MAWTFAAAVEAFGDRDVIGVICEGRRLAVYRLGGAYFATSDACPHQGASLSEGCVVEHYIECPAHFALFNIRTGESCGGPTEQGVKTYATRVEGGEVHVDIHA